MLSFKNTRLDIQQQDALETELDNVNANVYLFGSRADLSAKGGDVDLLLVLNDEKQDVFKTMMQVSRKYQTVCDEKIDVLVYPALQHLDKEQRSFFDSIHKICLTI